MTQSDGQITGSADRWASDESSISGHNLGLDTNTLCTIYNGRLASTDVSFGTFIADRMQMQVRLRDQNEAQ